MALNIDILSKLVRDLLLDNDRVTLPGLGYFYSEIMPAHFSDEGHTINPPSRNVSFRKGDARDDRLTEAYAAYCKISTEQSEKILKDFISEMTAVLFSHKTIIFPELGKLRATRENNIFFVGDANCNIYPEATGLHPISLNCNRENVIIPDFELSPAPANTEEYEQDFIQTADNESQTSDNQSSDTDEVTEETKEASSIESETEENVDTPRMVRRTTMPCPEVMSRPAFETPSHIKKGSIEEYRYHRDHQDEIDRISESEGLLPQSDSPVQQDKDNATDRTRITPMRNPDLREIALRRKQLTKRDMDKMDEPKDNRKTIILCVACGIIAFFLTYFIILKIFPDFVDSLLYTKEELEILHFFGK